MDINFARGKRFYAPQCAKQFYLSVMVFSAKYAFLPIRHILSYITAKVNNSSRFLCFFMRPINKILCFSRQSAAICKKRAAVPSPSFSMSVLFCRNCALFCNAKCTILLKNIIFPQNLPLPHPAYSPHAGTNYACDTQRAYCSIQ